MKISIKSLVLNSRFSRETTCYQATFCVNGIPAFTGENNGNGGSDFYRALDGKRELLHAAEVFAKTLPPVKYHDMELPMNLELLVSQLIAARDIEQRYDRLAKRSALVVKDGKLWSYKKPTNASITELITALVARGEKVLNAMPRDEALELFRTVG